MVTDSLRAKGVKEKVRFLFGNQWCIVKDGKAVIEESGTIAGSILKMNEALRNVIEGCEVDEIKAINACTINPARLLGLKKIGLIKKEFEADIVVIDDDYQIRDVYVKGVKQSI